MGDWALDLMTSVRRLHAALEALEKRVAALEAQMSGTDEPSGGTP